MSTARDLRHLVAGRRFRQLLAVRLTSQFADGVFQVALASYVLFSPERQPTTFAIAVALAAALLPFSVLGPFAGVFLDRWDRRHTIALTNVLRTVPVLGAGAVISTGTHDLVLVVLVIIAFSANRFLLAGLSAALPKVVPSEQLVLANSLSPTLGTLAFVCGLGAATTLRHIGWPVGSDARLVVLAAMGYLAAAWLATRLPPRLLGPDDELGRTAVRPELGLVVGGLTAGLRHLRNRPVASVALGVIAAHRFFYGLSTVATILLYRNYLNDPDDTEAGLTGLSIVVLVSGAGFLLAAVATPIATHLLTAQRWMLGLLCLAAVAEAFPGALYTNPALLVAALALGLSAQGVKICVDTLIQTNVDDAFRGRVFSLYDVVFNVVFVAAAAVGTVVIPANGKSYPLIGAISLGYACTAAAFAAWTHQRAMMMP